MTRRAPHEYNWNKLEFDETLLTKHFTPLSGRKITGVSIHHMIVLNRDMNKPDALDACYNIWMDRPASANYGVDGDFVRQFVWDKDFAWANANTWANNHLISIEHANATLDLPGTDNDYVVDERTFYTGAKLTAFVLLLNDLTPRLDPRFNGRGFDKSSTIFSHGQLSDSGTACPGPFMRRNINRYFDIVNDIYSTAKRGGKIETAPANPQRSVPQPAKKSPEAVAREVIQGVWGNGSDRFNRLAQAGYNPQQIQNMVNTILSNARTNTNKIAREVIRGDWGNGADRYRRLTDAGLNPHQVQAEVNRILLGR